MPLGKYFFIKSKLHGLVLDVLDGGKDPGTPVVPFEQKDADNDNQQWYVDVYTSTIRTKLNNFCLDMDEDNTLVVNPYKSGDENQQLQVAADRICQKANALLVVDIAEADEEPGARVCMYDNSGEDNQKWEILHLEAQYFYIVSELSGLVVDIWHSETKPGGKMITYPKNKNPPTDNQLWYEDQEGRLKCKQTNFTPDTSKDAKAMKMYPEEPGNPGQGWVVVDNRILNRFNDSMCVEIKKKSKKKKADLIPGEYKGEKHQQWKFEFIGSNVTTAAAREGGDDDDDDDEEDSD